MTSQGILEGSKAIKKSFPALPVEFYDMLTDRIMANGFSDERFIDAVNHVVDTCVYPQPTVAQFISYDKKIRLNSYEDMLKKLNEFGAGIWDSYKMTMLPDRKKPVWVHVDEIKFLKR